MSTPTGNQEKFPMSNNNPAPPPPYPMGESYGRDTAFMPSGPYPGGAQQMYPTYNQQPGQPIVMQPSALGQGAPYGQAPNIIINNVQTDPKQGSYWHNGLCDCCADIGNCCCGTFCPCILSCTTANAMQDSGCLYCCLSFCCTPFLPTLLLRTKAREKYGIPGSTCNDCCLSFCCTCCASIQVANEVKARNMAK